MPVRSFRETFSVDPNGGEQLVYQVPAGRTLILRELSIRAAGVGSAFVYRQHAAPAYILLTVTVGTTPLNQATTPPGWWSVMEAGDYLVLFGDAGLTVVSGWLSGALLLGISS